MKLTDMIKLGVNGFKPADIKQLNNSGVATDDIISLAKNGYSVTDINELIKMQDTEEVQPEQPKDEDQHGPADPEAQGESKDENTDLAAELEQLKQQLAEAQKVNSNRNLGSNDPGKEPEELFKDALRELY